MRSGLLKKTRVSAPVCYIGTWAVDRWRDLVNTQAHLLEPFESRENRGQKRVSLWTGSTGSSGLRNNSVNVPEWWHESTWKTMARLENCCSHDPLHLDSVWRILNRIMGKYCTIQVCKALSDWPKKTQSCNICLYTTIGMCPAGSVHYSLSLRWSQAKPDIFLCLCVPGFCDCHTLQLLTRPVEPQVALHHPL